MKPAPFSYHRARSAEEAVSLLAELGDDAKLLAGGQSLVAMMNFRCPPGGARGHQQAHRAAVRPRA